MTIYQQELLRKLPHFGCTGQYSETDEALAFFYDSFKIGWQDKAGYIYGAIDKDLTDEMRDAFYAVQDQAKAVREYTDLYETSPRMGIRDVDEYRRFANTVIPSLPECTAKSMDSCSPHGSKAQITEAFPTGTIHPILNMQRSPLPPVQG